MRKLKTEHAGAKNRGGHFGKREEAKRLSKRQRRENDKRAAVGEPVSLGRGEEGRRMALGYARVVPGRPRKDETAIGTSVRSLRLYNPEWTALEAVAEERGMSTHAAMREAIVQWLARAGAKKKEP